MIKSTNGDERPDELKVHAISGALSLIDISLSSDEILTN
jgi:hypothetical protein